MNVFVWVKVGRWDGYDLSKMGEGLCNSALSKGMKITTSALAGPQDVYVAGSFETQVWNGDRRAFVKIYNVAHFNTESQVWLPCGMSKLGCTWCTVTVMALAFDHMNGLLHIGGKFNSIDAQQMYGAGLALYDPKTQILSPHPAGGLSMYNPNEDGVVTALQYHSELGILFIMGSFERLSKTGDLCKGLAAWESATNTWTCLADPSFEVQPIFGENMILTPFGLLVAGRAPVTSSWEFIGRPYAIALLTFDSNLTNKQHGDVTALPQISYQWSWLPGYNGHYAPIHSLANGLGDDEGVIYIAGEDYVAQWSYVRNDNSGGKETQKFVPKTVDLSRGFIQGTVMTIAYLVPGENMANSKKVAATIIVYWLGLGAIIGMILAVACCNKGLTSAVLQVTGGPQIKGISLDTLTYSPVESSSVADAYQRAMRTRFVDHPHMLTIINPAEIVLHRIIGEGTFGRVWSARWKSSSVAVKEFVFAQAAVAGRSSMQTQIVDEIIGEAGMMAMLRHPNVLQLFGCVLTSQAIWIVSELCSLGSLRQVLIDESREIPITLRLQIALQVAEGMAYLHTQDPPIIHRDLKSHNILIHETTVMKYKDRERNQISESDAAISPHSLIVAKIGDWGSARAARAGSRTMTHGVGTACWLAPEVIKHARSSKNSDIYSFGIVLWELATREEVYKGLETMQIIARVANENLRPPVPQDCIWRDMMVKCWDENPHSRGNFGTIAAEINRLHSMYRKGSDSGCWSSANSSVHGSSKSPSISKKTQINVEDNIADSYQGYSSISNSQDAIDKLNNYTNIGDIANNVGVNIIDTYQGYSSVPNSQESIDRMEEKSISKSDISSRYDGSLS